MGQIFLDFILRSINISVIQHRDFNSYKYQLPGMSFYHLVELMISWSFSAMKSMKMSAQQNR